MTKQEQTKEIMMECPRCNGSGVLPHFAHVANGRCFLCMGCKKITMRELARNKRTVFSVWNHNENWHNPRAQPSYRVKCGWHVEDGKGGQTPLLVFTHVIKGLNKQRADKLVSRVEDAQLSVDHLRASDHWTY